MTLKHDFFKDEIFSYNSLRKRLSGMLIIIFSLFFALLIMYYYFFLQHSSNIIIKIINIFFQHIFSQIANGTLLGSFYTATLGGLFFVFMPMEAAFVTFATKHNPFFILFIFVFGFIISYTLNYFIGYKLANFSKSLIGARQFYKIKVKLNKYGSLAIYVFNALPLPSQPLSTILGIFKYNKTRFYIMFILGQVTKYLIMIVMISGFIGK